MKKLVIVMPACDYGGAQRFCLNFAKYLNSINYDYEIVFLRAGKSEELKKEFNHYKIKYKEFNREKAFFAIFDLIKYLLREKPKNIMSTVENIDFITAIARLFVPKTKFIIRKANVIFDSQINLKTKLILKYESLVCDKLISLTNEMAEDYKKYGFKTEKITVINNMLDFEYINLKLTESIENDKFNSIEKTKTKLIANARMVKEKRYDVLINAFKELIKNNNNVELVVLGEGPEKENIEKMIPLELKDKICFLGFQNNPYYFMKNSDIFILTSDYEGFPNVIIEAFYCGLPVISTNCKTGPKEIIIDNYNGFIVELGDYKNIVEKIELLLKDNNLMKMIKNNAKIDAQKYSVEKIAEYYIKIFD